VDMAGCGSCYGIVCSLRNHVYIRAAGVKEVKKSGISGVSAVKGLQGCGYVCNGYQW